VEKARRWC